MTKATSTMVGCAALWLTTACGGGAAPAPDAKKADAPAEPKKEPEDAGVAKRKADREAKATAKIEEEKKKAEKVAEITKLPEGKLPKKLDKACEALNTAYDAFMRKQFPDDVAGWDEKKGTQLGMMKKNCMSGTIEVAACQANAFGLATEDVRKEVPAIMSACIEKFSKKPAG
jgi:hypothetical protein